MGESWEEETDLNPEPRAHTHAKNARERSSAHSSLSLSLSRAIYCLSLFVLHSSEFNCLYYGKFTAKTDIRKKYSLYKLLFLLASVCKPDSLLQLTIHLFYDIVITF